MTESSQRLKRTSRAGIAAVSTIALALGGISVVGPGPLVSQATAAEFTGGLYGDDGKGVIAKDQQRASDLPAGSCVVQSDKESGSQAGVSWNVVEPRITSQDKTLFGYTIAFDNSQDRTVSDWLLLGSNDGAGNYVNEGEISAVEEGQKFADEVDWEVTHTAGEVATLKKEGRSPLTLTIAADLTDEKVEQFAKATAGNPVRYAWQDRYKQENTDPSKQILNSPDTQFTVNPWPSENGECNPITVSWENFEKHVIVPGEETKVGHINVPGVSDRKWWENSDYTDDSLSRMVVQAHDGNGQYIHDARVDDKGDIFFTWPEYRGTGRATDKNVEFSVVAKPRTTEQLKSAATHNSEFGEAFDSSNSLDRYSKPNVIDSKSFSLDDTEYHDPKYDKVDASIISGVDSATGPIATKPQKVTFTQVPDLIKNLEKKKGDGGFEAEVTLDEKYVYEGWTVEMDGDYNVTVTAPENPRPGTFARPVVTVEYSNGSTDELELLVVVDPNNTQVTDLKRPDLAKGKANDEITSQITTKSIMKGHKPVPPAKFEVDPSTVPEGWTVTVDETGKVTAKAGDTVAPGTVITPKVTATYPDGTTDEIEPQFQAIVDIKIPNYDTETNKPGTDVSLTPTVPERGLSGNTADEAPKRYTFEDGETEKTIEDEAGTWTVKINEDTGEITTKIPRTAPEGHILDIPVLAYYNEEKPQQVKGTVVVLKGDVAPVYDVLVTGPNQAVEHNVQDAPKGSKFSFGTDDKGEPITEQEVDGWKYKVDLNTGVVTSTPPADAKPGDKNTVNVTVTAPDGATPKVPVTTVVKLTNNWEAEPIYPVETVYPGGTATLPVALDKPDNVNMAKENPYKLGDVPAGWKATIDDNGQVTATAPADAKPGDQVEIPVTVTYEDGSTDTAYAVVNVVDVPTREVPFDVEYKYDDTVPAGTYKVEVEGVPGKEKQKADGTWERTVKPKNEVVVVGTKPAESAKDVTWTVPIPYPTEVRENPDLKPGETKVVQEGENGEKTYTAKFTAKGSEAQVAEEETTKEPVKRIVEYGPGLAPSELVTKTEKPIPFPTKVVFDDTLAAGEQKIDQKGELGTELETSTQKLVDGKPSGDPTVTSERTKEPTEQIIRVGTKTAGQTVNSVETEIPFEVEVVYDPTLKPGEQKVTQEGKPGTKKVTVTQPVENSKPKGEATVTEEKVKEPVKKIIAVGTKPAETSEQATWTVDTPYDTIVRPNPDLKPGEVKTVQEGEYGQKKFTADFKSVGEESTVTPKEEELKKPTDKIIEFGPTIGDQTLKATKTREIPFETEFVYDDTLPAGEQVVDQQGENGEEVTTSTQEIKDGKPVGEPQISTEETKPPKKAIIRIGTKKTTSTVTTTVTPTDEPEQPEEPTPAPSLPPKNVDLPFTTKIIYDETLEPGQEVVEQEGENGTAEVTVENGEPSVKTVKEPVEKIVRVGTKPAEGVEWTEQIPFDVKVELDPTLDAGEYKVAQQGKPGEVHHKSDGTEETVKEKVDHIIKIGTKTPTTEPSKPSEPTNPSEPTDPTDEPEQPEEPTPTPEGIEIEVAYTTKIVYDPNLKPGEEVEDVKGENGKYVVKLVDGKPVAELVEKPVERVVRVGTKPAKGVEWTEEIAYDVEVQEDPNLEAGKHEVVQEGKPGQRIHKEDGTVEENAPQKLIIKVGTNCNCETPAPPTDPTQPTDPTDPTDPTQPTEPTEPGKDGSSEKAERCFANAFAANSPLLWLLPIGILAGVSGLAVKHFQPQLDAAAAEVNKVIRDNTPDIPDFGWGNAAENAKPDWMREMEAQINIVNQQWGGYAEQLRPVGIAIGAIAAIAAMGLLVKQACTEEGFDAWFPPEGSSGAGQSKPDASAKDGSSAEK